ncbi:carboxymuconolactone decarboxylase family protein [Celerinatantimonas sp. YJH-8]|uniref:carboxymuconolactone decarboxylase family protein n=1 Tax=Celerinatantimonas sp. YJH-8 TaxID=3228714 RepID=UPI0038C0EA53
MDSQLSVKVNSYQQFEQMAPDVLSALQAMGKAVDDSGLAKELTELMKIRVSQMNHCAFCTQYHQNIARRLGVEAVKIDLVTVWRDAGVFSAREMAALEWAEKVTTLSELDASKSQDSILGDHFSESEKTYLTVAIAHINAWNRIAGTLHFPPLS